MEPLTDTLEDLFLTFISRMETAVASALAPVKNRVDCAIWATSGITWRLDIMVKREDDPEEAVLLTAQADPEDCFWVLNSTERMPSDAVFLGEAAADAFMAVAELLRGAPDEVIPFYASRHAKKYGSHAAASEDEFAHTVSFGQEN